MASEIALLLPVWNDWACVQRLLPELGRELHLRGHVGKVLIIDDSSTVRPPEDLLAGNIEGVSEVSVVRLACNLGHQRAIAVGLVELADKPVDYIVVMDSDGEDKPSDVPILLDAMQSKSCDVVFAGRLQRSESVVFRTGYSLYRLIHWLLTGVPVRFGNFSAIKRNALRQLIWHGSLWNHYAAAVVRSRLSYSVVPTARGPRYEGRSSLNFSQLVAHGLGALSVFSETITARLFVAAACCALVAVFCLVPLVIYGCFSLPMAVLCLGVIGLLAFAIALSGMNLIAQRSFPSFIPARDAKRFVERSAEEPR